MKAETSKKNNGFVIKGESLSLEDYQQSIRNAQIGPFYTLEEGKQMIEKWREQKKEK